MALKNFYTYYGQNIIFLFLSVRLRAISIFRYKVLANWAAGLSRGLFLCHFLRVLNGFIPAAILLTPRNERFRYIRLRLVFEKSCEAFRLNNPKTQCEQCLWVDNSRSGYSGFSLIGWGMSEAPLSYIHSKREANLITSLLEYLKREYIVPNTRQDKGTINPHPEI